MFQFFECLVEPYPNADPVAPPKSLRAFLWDCTRGLRPYILLMTFAAGIIGLIEALLYAMLDSVVTR